jgi:hypothetical protein
MTSTNNTPYILAGPRKVAIVMNEPGSTRSIATAVTRAATAYRANRHDLEPVIRLVADLLALAALARRRVPATSATSPRDGTCR